VFKGRLATFQSSNRLKEDKVAFQGEFRLTLITRIAGKLDIESILKLQAANLYANLSEAERAAGFVTTPFTVDQIQMLLDQSGVFVAEKNGVVTGYIFAGMWDFFSQWAIFPLMVSRFPQLKFQGTAITVNNTFQYGPVCVDRALRGSSIFPQLFETMRSSFSPRFPIGVTFINKINLRSLAAHRRKLGLEVIDEFEFNDNSYYSLAFSTRK
jgi:hypothetical protein